jgi:hypothetical protein
MSTDCLNLTVLLPEDLEELGSEQSESRDFPRTRGDSSDFSALAFLDPSEDDRSLPASADLSTTSGERLFRGARSLDSVFCPLFLERRLEVGVVILE